MTATRRHFNVGLATLIALPSSAMSQSVGRLPRIGWVTAQHPDSIASYLTAMREGLAEEGYIENKTIAIEYRYGNGNLAAVHQLVRELLDAKIDLLIAQGAAAFEVAKNDLPVPLIYLISADPVSAGFADSLAKPIGNKTGLTFMAYEFAAKRLEILRDILPNMKRVVVTGNPEHPGAQIERAYSEDIAKRLDLSILYLPTATEGELTDALARAATEKIEAISLLADGFAIQHRRKIMQFAAEQKIPAVSGWPVFAQAGALFTYGPRQAESYRRLAAYVSRVLKGAKPSELPVERPTRFELIINNKTARALGLILPPELLIRADEIID